MTSGEFTSVPIDFIQVDRETRQRRDLKKIPELAASIARVGLIHPPVIDRDGTLRTGERRYTAIRSLGWTHITVQFSDELDPAEAVALELEENISRDDIEWKEECLAIAKYHSIRQAANPEWTQIDTAGALGYTTPGITEKLSVARELTSGNERITAAPKYSVARGITRRTNARRTDSFIASNPALAGEAAPLPRRKAPLLNEDFNEWSLAFTGTPFNLLHCDFPYGVGADGHAQGQAAAMGGYNDSPDVYWTLVDTLAASMANVVAESAHLIFWFSMDYYAETFERLTAMGWRVNPFPLVWFKNDNTGILPDPSRGPRRVYETAFLASRGDRLIVGAKANAFAWPGKDKEIHMSEKPVRMLKHFMGMVVDEYSRVLDPTAGSANALKAATALGAPTVLGLERDPEFYGRSVESYYRFADGEELDIG